MADLLTEALDRERAEHLDLSIPQLVAYLYVCENEGLNLSELASVMRVTNQVASYTVRCLLSPGAERAIDPAADLVRAEVSAQDARTLAFSLTPRGARLRDGLEDLIRTGAAL